MTFYRKLKNVTFSYDTDIKLFSIAKLNIKFEVVNTNVGEVANISNELTKAEAAAFSRFVFSMIQYHSNIKKKGVKENAENQEN